MRKWFQFRIWFLFAAMLIAAVGWKAVAHWRSPAISLPVEIESATGIYMNCRVNAPISFVSFSQASWNQLRVLLASAQRTEDVGEPTRVQSCLSMDVIAKSDARRLDLTLYVMEPRWLLRVNGQEPANYALPADSVRELTAILEELIGHPLQVDAGDWSYPETVVHAEDP